MLKYHAMQLFTPSTTENALLVDMVYKLLIIRESIHAKIFLNNVWQCMAHEIVL